MARFRILHVAVPARAGGLEQVVQALALGHHRSGHAVGVAAIRIQGHPTHTLVETLRSAGVSVFEVEVGARDYASERTFIADVCARFRPDLVHTHGYRADVVDRPVAARLGIPTVTTVHGVSMIGGLKGAFYEWLQRRNYRRYDAVVAVSSALYDETLAGGVRRDRLHLIPNALGGLYEPLARDEARRALDLPLDAAVVGWVGRLIPVKGGDVFLDALARLPEPRPLAVVIGHGMETDALHAKARALGIEGTIRWRPDVDHAGRLFAAFDTYVLSSHSEGLPVVILEAMSAGAPIVATRVGGVPDALTDEDALLVPPADPAALAEAIHSSLADRQASAARARSARQRLATEFAVEPWLARYEHVYDVVTGGSRRADAGVADARTPIHQQAGS